MARPKYSQVKVGDRFSKTGDRNAKIWEVVECWDAVDNIPHVRLLSCDGQSSLITIAAGVLSDTAFFRPVASL